MKPAFGEVRCDACSEWADACVCPRCAICDTYSCRDEGHLRDIEADAWDEEIDR
jgi:hypothetical protein